jgi:hypothetical protein
MPFLMNGIEIRRARQDAIGAGSGGYRPNKSSLRAVILGFGTHFERLGRADLVCLTGMSIQGRRLIEILEKCKSRGVMTVVGGPMATVEPEVLEDLADVIFIGEADTTWPEFCTSGSRAVTRHDTNSRKN